MAKQVLAFDAVTGSPRGLMPAGSVASMRDAFRFSCTQPGCTASYHVRKAHSTHGNMFSVAETFVNNPGSQHKENCPADLERIASQHSKFVFLKDGALHVSLGFVAAASPIDRHPSEYYSQQFMQSVRDKKVTPRSFESMELLMRFIDKDLGGLQSETARNMIVHYQGREYPFAELLIGANEYKRLNAHATDLCEDFSHGKMTELAMVIAKPVHDLGLNRIGQNVFRCESQKDKTRSIVPHIITPKDDYKLLQFMKYATIFGDTLCLSARPVNHGIETMPEQNVNLRIHKPEQITKIDRKYWMTSAPVVAGSAPALKV